MSIESVPYEITKDQKIILKFDEIENLDDYLPYVSVVTSTRDRSIFYPLMLKNWNSIDYPRNKLEWVIVEEGDSDMREFLSSNEFTGKIKYHKLLNKTPLVIGEKRNICIEKTSYDIIVHMDDDDYYPPESVLTRVRLLEKFKDHKQCVGCSKVRCFNMLTEETFESYDPIINMSESSLAYTRSFFEQQPFNPSDKKAEGHLFIKDRINLCYDIPSQFIICQFTHNKNTVDRRLSDVMVFGDSFLDTIDCQTRIFIEDLRKHIILSIPEYKEAKQFIEKKLKQKKKISNKKMNNHIDALPSEVQKTSMICEFRSLFPIKTKYKNKELVYLCAPGVYLNHTRLWDYDENLIGGSEEAVLNISKYLADIYGWTVYIYNVRTSSKFYTFNKGTVVFLPYYKFNKNEHHTNIVIWRDISHLDIEFKHVKNLCLDLHDVVDPSWLSKKQRYLKVDNIFVKSEYHKSLLHSEHHTKCRIIPNGIIESEFELITEETEKHRRHTFFLSTSAADRCLSALLEIYPSLIEQSEKNAIIWCYGFDGLHEDNTPSVQNWVNERKTQILRYNRFINTGKLPINKISEMYTKCGVFLYPAEFPEIDCVSLTKAFASGCIPIYTDVGALNEKQCFGGICIKHPKSTAFHKLGLFPTKRLDYTLDTDVFNEFLDNVLNIYKNKTDEDVFNERKEMQLKTLDYFGICNITRLWIKYLQ